MQHESVRGVLKIIKPEVLRDMNFEETKRVQYTLLVIFVLLAFLTLAGALRMFFSEATVFFVGILGADTLLIAALLLLRIGRVRFGVFLTILSLVINVNNLIYAIESTGYMDLYRALAYAVATLLVTCLIAEERVFILTAGILGIASMIASYFITLFPPLPPEIQGDAISALGLSIFGIATATAISVTINSFSRDITAKAREEADRNRRQLEELHRVVVSSKEGLTIGERLIEISERGLKSVGDIENHIAEMNRHIRKLHDDIGRVEQANSDTVAEADRFKTAVEQQADAVVESTRAIGTITEGVSSISEVTLENREAIEALFSEIEEQQSKIRVFETAVEEIFRSSEEIQELVDLIRDIAEKTHVLSINAAIEASRAGESGTGFAVLAADIRALSQQTSTSAGQIEHALQTNSDNLSRTKSLNSDVQSTSERVFKQVKEAHGTFSEIVSMVERIQSSVEEVGAASRQLEALSRGSREAVGGIQGDLETGNTAIKGIHGGSDALTERMESLMENFQEISRVIRRIETTGRDNITQIEELHGHLANLDREGG
jgi:methyl-accepting chemotaxis protein